MNFYLNYHRHVKQRYMSIEISVIQLKNNANNFFDYL